jgi:phosphoribosylanthranilate isomerase
MRTRAKICGICRLEDALLADQLGADAIGLVFYAGSKRCVDIPLAARISAAIGPFVTRVGLFVNPDRAQVEEAIECAGIQVLQFHGDESRDFCASFGRPYIKALRFRTPNELVDEARGFMDAMAILVDSYQPDAYGGTGKSFDWSGLPDLHRPLVLAGGLTAENLARAVHEARPYALDVSSGVESEPGRKDAAKMRAFLSGLARLGEPD